jgi:hypothetical protein
MRLNCWFSRCGLVALLGLVLFGLHGKVANARGVNRADGMGEEAAAATPEVKVVPHANAQSFYENLIVTVTVAGKSETPAGSVVLSGNGYVSPAVRLNSGKADFYLAPGLLPIGTDTLTAKFTPDAQSGKQYASASGSASITITGAGSAEVTITIDTLVNRHWISPYVYGINTMNPRAITGLHPGFVRFGGNEASNYNWKAHTYNAGGDWFFSDFPLRSNDGTPLDSVELTKYAVADGSRMLTTMPMLSWVAKEKESWSYSVAKFGAQCKTNPNNSDAGNGQKPDCKTHVNTEPVTDAYYPLVDTASDCRTGNCLYRDEWARALSAAFGKDRCFVPYFTNTSCHFYDMDNEPEIWDGSHADVHPAHPGYSEMATLFVEDGNHLKQWDPDAVRFGPITCCWNFYWSAGGDGDNREAHAGIDFLPWWLNHVYWEDQIHGSRSLDVFDLHAYVGANVETDKYTDSQKRAAAGSVYRTWWDPKFYNQSIDADWITKSQPNRGVTFDIPRMKALVNAIYPGTPLSFSEWESFLVPQSEWDFATALSDADAFGVMGREGLSFSTRWGGPEESDEETHQPHPNYQAMKLYTDYDGARHGFGTLSIADQTTANSDLFNSFAALDDSGNTMTIMVLNKDPNHTVHAAFHLNGFEAANYRAYTLLSTRPGAIQAAPPAPWKESQTFAPYSVTLLVVQGAQRARPAIEWYLNPDDLMIPALGSGTLNPMLVRGDGKVTLTSAVFDAYEGTAPCRGSLTLTDPVITKNKPATIQVKTGGRQGFCHYQVTGSDGVATQTEGGWIVVGAYAGDLAKSGDGQKGKAGEQLPSQLTVNYNPDLPGSPKSGAEIFFVTSDGVLFNGKESGTKLIATTDAHGNASVKLTLPAGKGTVTVTAQSQFAVGGAKVTFTEYAQ